MSQDLSSAARADVTRRQAMTQEQCADVLRGVGWGVLGVAEHSRAGAVPVGVPTAYAFDGEWIYIAMAPGRKHSALERNPHLCLTVAEVRSLDCWRSVVVIGAPRWITDPAERGRALAAFAAQHRPQGQRLTMRAVAQLTRALVLALVPAEIHGFAAGSAAEDREAPGPEHDGWEAHAIDTAEGMERPSFSGGSAGSEVAARSEWAGGAMNAIRQVVRAIRTSHDVSQSAAGVSAAQLFVLRQIEQAGGPTIGELARRTVTAQSSVSEVVARLATRGLVSRGRSSTDRRRAEVTLTPAGRDVLVQAPETIQEQLLAAFERLPEQQQRALAEGLVEWSAEAGLDSVAATMFFEPLLEES